MKLKELINKGHYHILYMDYSQEEYKDYLKKLIDYNTEYNLKYPIIMLGCAAPIEGDSGYELCTYFDSLNSLKVSQRTMPEHGTVILQSPTFLGPDFIKSCYECKGTVVVDDDKLKEALTKMGCSVWEDNKVLSVEIGSNNDQNYIIKNTITNLKADRIEISPSEAFCFRYNDYGTGTATAAAGVTINNFCGSKKNTF